MTRTRWIWLILAAAATVPFLPSLQGEFVFDDTGVILDNKAVWESTPWAAAHSSYWPGWPEAGLYRPVTILSYWLTARIFGRAAWAFHAGNLLLNAAVAILLTGVLLRLFPRHRGTALAASFIFAVHPLHSEAVASIVGRAELWAAFWSMAAYSLALRTSGHVTARVVLSSLAFALALLSKESAAGLMALPVLHSLPWASAEATRRMARLKTAGRKRHHAARPGGRPDEGASEPPDWRWIGAGWAMALAAVMLLRIRVLGSLFGLERVGMVENVLAYADPWTRVGNAMGFQWILIRRLFVPWTLSADFSYPQLVPSGAWAAAGVLLLAMTTLALAAAIRRRSWPWTWGIGWILGTGLLTSNLLFPLGTVLAERLAYLPSAGAIWLIALAFTHVTAQAGRPVRTALWALAILWVAFLSVRSFLRSQDWRDGLSLYTSAVAAAPRSAKMWSNLSRTYTEADRLPEAMEAGRKAVALLPEYTLAARALGAALARSGHHEEALEVLERIRAHGERDPQYLTVLGNILLELGRAGEAEHLFRRAISLDRISDSRHSVGLASSLAMQERWAESREAWRSAVMRHPDNLEYRRVWAYTVWQAGSPDSAEALYRSVLTETPRNPAVLNDMAWFLAVTERDMEEALRLAGRAFSMNPSLQTGDTWLEALVRARGCGFARSWFDSLSRAGVDAEITAHVIQGLEDRCGTDEFRASGCDSL